MLEDGRQSVDALNSDLVKKWEERGEELLNARREMEIVQKRGDELERQLNAQLDSLESTEARRETAERLLRETRHSLEREIESLRMEKDSNERRIKDLETELDAYRNSTVESTTTSMESVQDNAPRLFDASRIFGSAPPDSDPLADKEVKRLQSLLEEKEARCSNLSQEIDQLQRTMVEDRALIEQLKLSRNELDAARADLERAEQLLAEREKQIDSLNVELRNSSGRIAEEDKLKESLSAEHDQLRELNASLNSVKGRLDETIAERNQQDSLLRSYELQLNNLETELKNSTEATQDLEKRVLSLTKERDLLQLQVNDLTRSMEELRDDSMNLGRSLHTEIERVGRERDEAKETIANLSRALDEACKTTTPPSTKESTPCLEQEERPATEENASSLTIGEGAWDAGSTERINVDEEIWGWNTEDAQLASEQAMASTTLIPNTETQLRARVEDLQDRVKDLEEERARMGEENKAAQLRNARMIKKLKEYKVQAEGLQRQLKIQRSATVDGLDSAIEEELRSQIDRLERNLNEAKEERRCTMAEKEALIKRLDVVVSANERYMEMKERQDMDMEVLRIRNKELSDKVEILDKRLQGGRRNSSFRLEDPSSSEGVDQAQEGPVATRGKRSAEETKDFESLSKKYKEEMDDLKDEMEALATENEQLQHFLEEQKIKLSALESKRSAEEDESIQIVDELNGKISELQAVLSKSREEYDLLRRQYEQSLMDANDQVTAMRQNADYLKEEAFERTGKLEMEIADLRQQLEASESNVAELRKNLESVSREKLTVEEKLTELTASSEKQISSLNASMLEVTDLLNIRIQEVAELKQELQKQYVDNEEAKMKLQNTVRELNREFEEKRQETENLRRSFSEKEKEFIERQSVETVSAVVGQATQELMQRHAIEIEERERHVQNLNERLSTFEVAINEYLLEKQNNVAQLDAQRQELEGLRHNLTEKESSLASVGERFTSMEKQLAERALVLSEREETIQRLSLENQRCVETIEELSKRLNESAATSANEYTLRIQILEQEVENTRSLLDEKEAMLRKNAQEATEYRGIVERNRIELSELRTEAQKVEDLKSELNSLNSELEATRKVLEGTRQNLNEKTSLLEQTKRVLNERQTEIDRLSSLQQQDRRNSTNMIDGLPVFRMGNEEQNLQHTIDNMQVELEKRQEEIEHLKYILNENTYPGIIQEMQQRINCLYNEKAELESSLVAINATAEEKEKQIHALERRIETQSQEYVSKEEASLRSRDRRSIQEQEQIVRLQNELYAKEQEINELKYIVAEKESQLSVQASMEPQSDEFELREMVQRLTAELYGKEEEIKHMKLTIVELQREVSRLQEFERLSEQTKDAVQKLNAEKEQIRLEGEEFLERKLKEKEMEIDEIKRNLAMENQKILDELSFNNRDIENLKGQLMELSTTGQRAKDELRRKEEDLMRVNSDLAEKERRLAELSITKDAELHNLKIQIYEKDARIEELVSLYEEGEKRFTELKNTLTAREIEINSLKTLLEDKVKEYQLIQSVLKKDVSVLDTSTAPNTEASDEKSKASTSQELDLALYMLHQRDVRCEELTHELMQLLEERDTLQLRLSNAIRINEDLRKGTLTNVELSPKKEASTSEGTVEPIVEHPSPSKSEGPVEIAKEAIDAPIGENKEILAQKYVLFTLLSVSIKISQ